jgi:hypothetical protein
MTGNLAAMVTALATLYVMLKTAALIAEERANLAAAIPAILHTNATATVSARTIAAVPIRHAARGRSLVMTGWHA